MITRVSRVALALAAGAALLCACNKEDVTDAPDGGDRIPVTFSAGIESAAVTRTVGGGNTWTSTDRIGIVMSDADYDIGYGEGTLGIIESNIEYAADKIDLNDKGRSTATFTPVSGNPIYYPRTGNVDFYVYYPYTAVRGNDFGQLDDKYDYRIDLSDQSDPAAIDVLYAEAKNVAPGSEPVDLTFRHVLSKITLDVTAGAGIDAADIAALTADDVVVTSSLGAIVGLGNGGKARRYDRSFIDLNPYKKSLPNAGADATFSIILPPDQGGDLVRIIIAFFVRGKNYKGEFVIWDLLSGINYVYPVTVRKTGTNTKSRASVGDRICIEVGTCSVKSWEVENKDKGMVEKESSNPEI